MPKFETVGQRHEARLFGGEKLSQRGVVSGATDDIEVADGIEARQQQLISGRYGQRLDAGREDRLQPTGER